MRTLAARRISQTALRTFLKWVKERPLPFVEDVEIDGALVENSKNTVPKEFCITMVRSIVLLYWIVGSHQPIWIQKP